MTHNSIHILVYNWHNWLWHIWLISSGTDRTLQNL